MVTLKKTDIGADIISILTRGIYTDPRDTIREYIQNGVDAGAKNITIKIRHNMAVIEDTGSGMDFSVMREAIRLGVSKKNPKTNVGFMGIGIYSSFHVCDSLTIYSKVDSQSPNKISFNFLGMKKSIDLQKKLRIKGKIEEENIIALQTLLEENIKLEKLNDEDYPTVGTRVEILGINPEVFELLSNFNSLSGYLESVIPLPFNPRFRMGPIIEEKIRQVCRKHNAEFKVINVRLQINEEVADLYRPYRDDLFDPNPLKPFIKELKQKDEFFGVAWGCLNSSRDSIKNKKNKRIYY